MRTPGSHLYNCILITWNFSLIDASADTNRRFVLKNISQLLLQPQELLSILKPRRRGNSLSVVIAKAVFNSKVGECRLVTGPDKS